MSKVYLVIGTVRDRIRRDVAALHLCCLADRNSKQVVKVIRQNAASLPYMDGSPYTLQWLPLLP